MRIIEETALGTRRLVVVSRDSAVARMQVHGLMDAVPAVACEWLGADDPNDVLLKGEADVALFDADLLSYPLPAELTIAAIAPENLAVLCRSDRADLRGLFHSRDIRNSYGQVWLVGAGPGSADLITLRGIRVLAQADIVYYDDLVDDSLLAYCPGEHVYVGKRKGRSSHSQDSINEMLYRSALEGKTVVRLKGGDPSIFGRAGEELDYLRRRWITTEVVPGVTSASAAAAAGLFSLTHRGISRSASFRSGHGIDNNMRPSPEKGTFVYYMAVSKLNEISHELIREGVPLKTPVAIISNAGAWNEASVLGTVETMKEIAVTAPALVVVGNVAAYSRVEKKALSTGIDPGLVKVKEPIIHQPLITQASGRVGSLPKALDLSYFSAVIFSSPAEVDAFEAVYGELPDHLLCYAADNKTRTALEKRKISCWRIVSCLIRGKFTKNVHRVA